MAYRAPRPDAVKHSVLQTRLARIAGACVVVAVLVIGAGMAERAIPPQHAPWKPLTLAQPIGSATRIKTFNVGDDPAQCRATLRMAGIEFTEVPSREAGPGCVINDALTLDSGLASLVPARTVLTCRQALAVSIWERQVVQPAAIELLGETVTRIDHYGSYSCRRIYNQAEGAMSQHATANALDIAAFRTEAGERVEVLADWNDPGPKGRFLRAVRDGACQVFGTTLGPEYNAAHANHLHLDMGRTGVCS